MEHPSEAHLWPTATFSEALTVAVTRAPAAVSECSLRCLTATPPACLCSASVQVLGSASNSDPWAPGPCTKLSAHDEHRAWQQRLPWDCRWQPFEEIALLPWDHGKNEQAKLVVTPYRALVTSKHYREFSDIKCLHQMLQSHWAQILIWKQIAASLL